MLESLLEQTQENLNKEKFTRAVLNDYSARNFKELDEIFREAQELKGVDELKKLCDEHLAHSQKSIIALYLSGMCALSRQLIDDAALVSLISLFADNHKDDIVKYLCERILDYGESKFALRTLADYYKSENDDQRVFAIWERLVKADYEEADLAKSLAERFDRAGDDERAIEFYKKALHRYLNKQLFANAREIWDKLLVHCPDNIEFFLQISQKTAKLISTEKASALLLSLYDSRKKQGDIDNAILILKLVLDYDEKDNRSRQELIGCYRKKYEKHSQLEDYIRLSDLDHQYRNVSEAIADFEKHIAFDRGNFVSHKTWGVGRIAGITGEEITIDFAKKRGHTMSLKMAVNALQTLSKNHIWVLKATWKKEKLYEKVKNDVDWTLKTVIKSFGNACDMKKIKDELASILSPSEWLTWNVKAKQLLKTEPSFGVCPTDADVFTVRDHPISIEEKLYNEFKAEKNFFDRARTMQEFAVQKDFEVDSDYFNEMFGYFSGYLKSYTQVNEQIIASYLIVKNFVGKFPQLGTGLSLNFAELFEEISDVSEVFDNLKIGALREDFLKNVKLFAPSWSDVYLKLFPYALLTSMLEALEREGFEDKLAAMARNCFENYREYRDAVIWLFNNASGTAWFQKAGISYEKQLVTLIRIMDISFREVESKRNPSENRKLIKQAYTILFKDGAIQNFADTTDKESITRVYAFINDVKDLDPADKIALRNRIIEKHPDFKFTVVAEEKTGAARGLTVTMAKYEEKKKLLDKLMNEDLPANSKELEYALSLGDLRENAEYKAAKEKQGQLNTTIARLEDEIERAQLFDPKNVNTNRVSFGTKVRLVNNTANKTEEYAILGPWESDPQNGILSYLAPFGGAMFNRTAGERFDWTVDGNKVSYTVEQISAVPFDS